MVAPFVVAEAVRLGLIRDDEVPYFASDGPASVLEIVEEAVDVAPPGEGAKSAVAEPVDDAERLTEVVRGASSGVAAIERVRRVVVDGAGHEIPPPPSPPIRSSRRERAS